MRFDLQTFGLYERWVQMNPEVGSLHGLRLPPSFVCSLWSQSAESWKTRAPGGLVGLWGDNLEFLFSCSTVCYVLCQLCVCVSAGLPGCCCQGNPSEREAGGGRAGPQSDPVLPASAVSAQQRPAEGAGGAGGTLVQLHEDNPVTFIRLLTL